MVIFATQNVIKDPPFTKLDLVSCRNLLIYLEPELQNRLITVFHYALKPDGILFLSPSESIGSHLDLFKPINKKWKFFQAEESIASPRTLMAGGISLSGDQTGRGLGEAVKKVKETNFAELTKRVLLQSYAPPSVVTDEKGNILYVHGDTGKYLRPAPGQASLNVIEMAREELQLEMRTAVHNAATQKKASGLQRSGSQDEWRQPGGEPHRKTAHGIGHNPDVTDRMLPGCISPGTEETDPGEIAC